MMAEPLSKEIIQKIRELVLCGKSKHSVAKELSSMSRVFDVKLSKKEKSDFLLRKKDKNESKSDSS